MLLMLSKKQPNYAERSATTMDVSLDKKQRGKLIKRRYTFDVSALLMLRSPYYCGLPGRRVYQYFPKYNTVCI